MAPQSWSSSKHAFRVRLLKLASVFIALAIAFYLGGLSFWHSLENRRGLEAPSIDGTRAEGLDVFGLDRQKNGFQMHALKVKQDPEAEDVYDLDKVDAEFLTEAKEKINVLSDFAHFDKKENKLFLRQNVHFKHEQGYDFTTSRATIDLKTNHVEGDDVVEGEGPSGHIHAQGFHIFDKGDRIVFGKTIAHVQEKPQPSSPLS